MTTSPALPQILPLTSARFFAALYVVLYHVIPWLPWLHGGHGILMRMIGLGYVSVSFFFMLSGFILALVYLSGNKPIRRRRFFVSRFARIYPLYAAAMLLALPHFVYSQHYLARMSTGHIVTVFFATAGLVQAWFSSLGGLNSPGWSLSAEAFFYLLFPFAGTALWRLRGQAMVPFSALLYLGGILLVEIVDRRQAQPGQQSYNPLFHLFVFLLGICLAKFFVWIRQSPARILTLQRCAPWLLTGSVAAFLALPAFDLKVSEALLQHGLLAPLFALAILAFAGGHRVIAPLFSARWLVVLGEASFALYLIHFPLYEICRRSVERYGPAMAFLYFALAIGLSVASLYWLETPARRWILEKEHVRSLENVVISSLAQ